MKIGIIGLTFLIMFTAKVFGFTDLSWWLVTAPVWGLVAVVGSIWAVCVFILAAHKVWERRQ